MKKMQARKRVLVVFTAMIIAFFFYVNAGGAMASLAPTEGTPAPKEKTIQYTALHHSAPCINFVGGPMQRKVCIDNSSFPYTFKEGVIFSSRFRGMLVLWHNNAAIPLTSWLWIESRGSQNISMSLSDGYNEPYAEGQGSTFSEAMEDLFSNVFPHHGEKEALPENKE